ncbi:MAG: DMT family protein [Chitinophaga sp.]|uniref:DMT family protein n=1 Tax=Chitinophaga sp. TaxID=1869181 RepID=UPI0025B95288|nr:DMT family protein [Chitinophaga sp.]MBV8251195.1 DMT family protein [Chitinophaga sp.]
MRTILLLLLSNSFMTYAWYGHLKQTDTALWKIILISWGIAFFEYCFMVPANRYGVQEGFNGFQLKTIQEVVSLTIFGLFAIFFLKEPLRWNYMLSFALLIGAAYFMFKK